ncbi:MAG: fused MFS/spermidine synthase [Thermoanaerobaculum sp.]|nr:fused MFS/spermidine synthase [Thermoanaerobaculum sp.]
MATLVLVFFVVSGACALAYQVVWVRVLGLVVGNSLWAAVAVVAAYMGGMALGSWWAGRWARRLRRHLRWYAACEAVAALWALATPWTTPLLAHLAARLGPEPTGSWGLPLLGRFATAWLFLLVPTVALGATLPMLAGRLKEKLLGLAVARLYAANTLGAVLGTVGTGFFALPLVGERGSMAVAASLALLVAGGAWLLENRLPPSSGAPPTLRGRPGWYLLYPFAFGFVALSLELVWTRILLLHLGSRVYAFVLVLAVYLGGLALGSALVRRWIPAGRRALAWCQALLALSLLLQIPLLRGFSQVLATLGGVLKPQGFLGLELTLALAVALLLGLPTVLFGASFPLAVEAVPGGDCAGQHAGLVAAANTVGAILGSLCGPLVLVPLLGTQRALLLFVVVAGTLAVSLKAARGIGVLAGTVGAVALLALWRLPPETVLYGAGVLQQGQVEEVRESAEGTVIVRRVQDARGPWRSLEINGVNVAGTSPELWAIQRLQGHLPLLLHPYPKSVLHIGFGSGGTAWAVAQHRSVQEITVAEISPVVLEVADRLFVGVNHGVLADPRVRVVVNDGRNVLLVTDRRFDVILSDSIHPVFAGNSSLYTLEYFALCRQRLNPAGVVSMWLPLYSLRTDSYLAILRAFWEVFPTTLVWYNPKVLNEFTVVTGSLGTTPVALRWEALMDPSLQVALAEAGIHRPEDVAAMVLLGPEEVARLVAGSAPHRDDFPEVEYLSGRLLEREGSWLANFSLLWAARSQRCPFAVCPGDWEGALRGRDRALEDHRWELARRAASP